MEDLLDKFNREDNMIERIVCGIIELDDDLVEKYGFKNVKLEKDGDSFCVKLPDFKNLQESVAGFGNTIDEAIEDLYKNFTAENKKDRIEELENKVHGIECTMRAMDKTIKKEKQSDDKLMHGMAFLVMIVFFLCGAGLGYLMAVM